MVTIDLRKTNPEDIKIIQELKSLGVSDEIIQLGYKNTVRKREDADSEQEVFSE